MSLRHVLLCTAAAFTLNSCGGGLPRLLEPQVGLRSVVVRGIGLTGGSIDLLVDVENPNDIDLRVVGVDAGLEVERGLIGEIRSRDIYDLPARGRTTITLPLRFEWSGVPTAFRSALGYGDLPFRFRGQVSFAAGNRIVDFPFTREGRVPLSRALSIPLGEKR